MQKDKNMSEQQVKLSKKQILLQKKEQIENRLKAIEAREKTQSRKEDTRKKVVLGAILLRESQTDPELLKVMASLIEKLDERDKKLFL
jgi:preprotein translocase subunit SecD